MTSGKVLGVKILIANTAALFLILTVMSSANLSYTVGIPSSVNGTPQYDPNTAKIDWQAPTTGTMLDWLLVFYFSISYALALWLIFNPFS